MFHTNELEYKFLIEVNNTRLSNGLHQLKNGDKMLYDCAKQQAKNLSPSLLLRHNNKALNKASDDILDFHHAKWGARDIALAENLGRQDDDGYFGSPENLIASLLNGFLQSPAHRRTLLSQEFSYHHAGFSVVPHHRNKGKCSYFVSHLFLMLA